MKEEKKKHLKITSNCSCEIKNDVQEYVEK